MSNWNLLEVPERVMRRLYERLACPPEPTAKLRALMSSKRRLRREDRLRELGFEEVSPAERKAHLEAIMAQKDWPSDE